MSLQTGILVTQKISYKTMTLKAYMHTKRTCISSPS